MVDIRASMSELCTVEIVFFTQELLRSGGDTIFQDQCDIYLMMLPNKSHDAQGVINITVHGKD